MLLAGGGRNSIVSVGGVSIDVYSQYDVTPSNKRCSYQGQTREINEEKERRGILAIVMARLVVSIKKVLHTK